MRRSLVVAFALVVGFAAGFASAGRKPPPPPPIDWAGEIGVIKGHPPSINLRPHSVIVDGRPRPLVVERPAPDAEIWVILLDDNRVKIACTQVP
jgi:hypothetical protein